MNEVTIITPCSRPENLPLLCESLEFSFITKWLIIYDSSKGYKQPQFKHPKITEFNENRKGISGNTQRNKGLENTRQGFIYFLDDDNIIHPNFWKILPEFSKVKVNLFKIEGHPKTESLNLQKPGPSTIDTSMYCIDRELIGSTRWLPHLYSADGVFAAELYSIEPNSLKIFDEKAAYYNYLITDTSADFDSCARNSAKETAEIILANKELYSQVIFNIAKFTLSRPEKEIANEDFAYIQVLFLAKYSKTNKKNIFIRGVGEKGQDVLNLCKKIGLEIKGFILSNDSKDTRESIQGTPIYYQSQAIKNAPAFFLICSIYFVTIEKEMEEMGLKKDADFITLF